MKKRILFLYNTKASWAIRDLSLFRENFEVMDFYVDKALLLRPIKCLCSIVRADYIYAWFGSFSFIWFFILGRVLGKKVIIVAGGYDVARDDKFSHGAFCETKLRQSLRVALFKMASRVVAVSRSNRDESINNAKIPEKKVRLVYHGFQKPLENILKWESRLDQVVMVSNLSLDKFFIKGGDQLLELALRMPSISFILIGGVDTETRKQYFQDIPSNLKLKGVLEFDGEEFNQVLNESKVIIQLSHYESFGASVIDGALRGCFPIVYKQFGLVETVEDFGISVNYGDIEKIASSIQEILDSPQNSDEIANRFYKKFSLTKRQRELEDVINLL